MSVAFLLALVCFFVGVQSQCSQWGNNCSACIADTNCGYCSVFTTDPAFQPCMRISDGPSTCPRYPDRWETGTSQILRVVTGYPVNPSEAFVYLRRGETLRVPIRVTSPVTDDLDLELYFIQDMSGSFRNDINFFAGLLPQLIRSVLQINSRAKWGLSTFNEMPLEPFGYQNGATNILTENAATTWTWSPQQIAATNAQVPCPLATSVPNSNIVFSDVGGRQAGGGTYAPLNWRYCLESPLSADSAVFQRRFAGLIGLSHDNLDYPEPSMDAIWYVAHCTQNWGARSRKVAVVVTDARWQTPAQEICTTNLTDVARFGNKTCALGAGSNFVTLGYLQRENDLDCTLQLPTWTLPGGSNYWTSARNSIAPTWRYSSNASRDTLLPGTAENYIPEDTTRDELLAQGIIPLIACAQDSNTGSNSAILPENRFNLFYWEELVGRWNFGYARLLVRQIATGPGSLTDIVLSVLSTLSSEMRMIVAADPENYVSSYVGEGVTVPYFQNVPPGEQRTFFVDLYVGLTSATPYVIDGTTITMRVLGFGDTVIHITNETVCRGCQSDPNRREDLCGFCWPEGTNYSRMNLCLDCAGVAGGQSRVDACGVCGGTNACLDCARVPNGAAGINPCGRCLVNCTSPTESNPPASRAPPFCATPDEWLSSGCTCPPGQAISVCGICEDAVSPLNACVGCDGNAYSGWTEDACGDCLAPGEGITDSASCTIVPVLTAAETAGIVAGVVVLIILVILMILAILARLGKNIIDERKFMNAFAAGNAIGTNPLHEEKASWSNNPISGQ